VEDLQTLYDTINSFDSAIITLFNGNETISNVVDIKGIDQYGLILVELPNYQPNKLESYPIPAHLELFRKGEIELNISGMANLIGSADKPGNLPGGNLKIKMFYAEYKKRASASILQYLRGNRFRRKIMVLR
jgi:hypothetical protein